MLRYFWTKNGYDSFSLSVVDLLLFDIKEIFSNFKTETIP